MTFNKIGIVGLGLIGGSIALRAKSAAPTTTIVGYTRRKSTLDYALQHGIIDQVATRFSDFDGVDAVFVCTPIPDIMPTLVELDQAITRPCILTDVASLKDQLWNEVRRKQWRHDVILGHPMAGKEISGIEAADPDLLINKTYIVIPSKSTRYLEFLATLECWGCRVLELTAADHDRYVAYASHLPYVAAIVGAGMAAKAIPESETPSFFQVTSSGFRDTTRVADSDPQWGADVLLGNATHIRDGIATARQLLNDLEHHIQTQNRADLIKMLNSIRAFREPLSLPAPGTHPTSSPGSPKT
ncbi:prephenate dehydrogenase/arogenate dehydrogenase family protein [bacterium]|nr:prephenate dehydrogenase/arogenate dehydrogenase family protein [bacterium]